jgi:hypothetical protein
MDNTFSAEMLLTVSGATAVTFLVVNGIKTATGKNPAWLPLVVALVTQVAAWALFTERTPQGLGTAVITAFLVVYGLSYFYTSFLWKFFGKDKERLAMNNDKPRFLEPWW